MKKTSTKCMLIAGMLSMLPFVSGCSSQTDPVQAESSAKESTEVSTETEESSAAKSSEQVSSEEKVQVAIGSEIGVLDYTPIEVLGQGWICQKDGRAGFLSADGTWEIDSVYPNVLFTIIRNRETDEYLIESPVQLYDPDDLDHSLRISPEGIEEGELLASVGPIPYFYFVNSQTGEVEHNMMGEILDSSSPKFQENKPNQPRAVWVCEPVKPVTPVDDSSYLIWSPRTGTLSGPYSEDDYPAFGLQPDPDLIRLFYGYDPDPSTYGPFWEKAANGSYTVYSSDGTEMIYGLDFAEPAGFNSMMIRSGDDVSVLDGSLQTVFETKGEAAALPIENTVPVKRDGKWILEDISEK